MAKGSLEFPVEVDVSEIQRLLDLLGQGVDVARELNTALGGTVRKTVALEYRADDSGAKKLVAVEKERLSATDAVTRAIETRKKVEEGSLTSLRQQVNTAKQARDGIVKYETGVNALGRQVTTVSDRWIEQNNKVQQLQRQLDLAGASGFWDRAKAGLNVGGLLNFANGLTQITNGLQSASIIIGQVIGSFNNLFNVVAKLQQFELTFKAIGATQGETALAFEESARIALGLGVNIDTVREAFQQLTPVVLSIGGSINSVSQITEALSSRFVAFGLSADKSRRVLNGVIQAFGKGKLMAEELTQQISEADPAFRTDLASAIGVSVKELNQLVKDGEITSKVLLDILPKLSKSSLLFGKLGSSAQSAAGALRKASRESRESGSGISVTFEQVQQQIQNLNTINLQNLGKALQPLLFSILEVTAVITDLSTTLINSQGFKTFAEFVNNLATQFSATLNVIGAFITAIIQIVGAVASVVNAIDGFLAQFLQFRPIVGAVAALITSKLVVALIGLSVKGATGLAIVGLKALATASVAFSSGGIGGLTQAIGASLLSFAGFKKATLDQIKDNYAAVASLRARAQAQAQLAATQGVGGLAAGFGPAAMEAAGRRAAIKQAEQQAAANARVTATNAAVGASGVAAGAGLARMAGGAAGAAAGVGILGRLGSFFLGPWGQLAILAITIGYGFYEMNKSAKVTTNTLDQFNTGLEGIKERSQKAIDALNSGSSSSEGFRKKLDELRWTADQDFQINIDFKGEVEKGFKIFEKVDKEVNVAKDAVKKYSEALDTTGIEGEKAAQKILAAESANQLAIDVTRQKRDQLYDEATKGGKAISQENARQLASYQDVIDSLENQRINIQLLKREAAGKGIKIEVSADNQAKEVIEEIKTQSESLKAQILLEADPQKYADLQQKLNGLEARLSFLQADRIELAIDVKYKVDQAGLQNALNISQATIENERAQSDVRTAMFGIDIAALSAKEKAAQKELKTLQDMEASKETIAAKEAQIEAIAEKKQQIEAASIAAQLQALPAIEASELKSLELNQQLVELEAERTRQKNQQLIAALEMQKIDLASQAQKADDRNDTDRAQELRRRAILAQQQIALIEEEQRSLNASVAARREINSLQRDTLMSQQEAKRLGLEAQLTELGQSAQGSASAYGTLAAKLEGLGGATGNLRIQTDGLANNVEAAGSKISGASGKLAGSISEIKSELGGGLDLRLANELGDADSAAGDATNSSKGLVDQFNLGVDATRQILDNLEKAALDRSAGFKVNYTQGLWTGGPAQGGQVYRVNELGREGFLSAGGTLSPINKPRNALWRAPSSGTVIPAHIMQALDAPMAGVNVRQGLPGAQSKDSGMRRLSRALQMAFAGNSQSSSGINELANVQAHQARQIGKLSRAVGDLARKDWNVNVGVRVKDDAAYLSALNHRL